MRKNIVIQKERFPTPHPGVELFLVTYDSFGLEVKGLLAVPKGSDILDGFLYLRGGIKNVGKVRPGRIIQFASEGFVVFAPFYRGNQGGEGYEDFGGEDRLDAISAFDVLASHPRVHEDSIHVFGFSRGGVMALWTALERNVASLVTWGGVSDMELTYVERKDLRRMMKRVIGGTPQKVPEEYEGRTPLYELETLSCPVLIIHGEKDQNVGIEHARRLEKRLIELGKKVESMYFSDFTHYFPPAVNRKTVNELCQWMRQKIHNNKKKGAGNMGMPLELNTMIVTDGKETRIQENSFELVKEGYRLYPIEIPIEVRKTEDGEVNGTALIDAITWTGKQTLLSYRLVSLNSTN